jgi:hypothetical protein
VTSIRRALPPLAVLGTAVTSGLLVSASPASAASVSCTAGRLCIYRDTNFEGWARRFTVTENDYDTVNWWNFATNSDTGDGMDTDASSVINKTGGWVRLYQDEGYQGRVICIGNNGSVHRLGIFTFDLLRSSMDNRVSAHSLSRTDTCDFRVEAGQNL